MKILIIMALSLCLSGISYAQSKSETFAGIQKLHHVKGEPGNSRTSTSVDLYFLAKDYDEMERLMKNGTR